MKITPGFEAHRFFLAAAFLLGLGWAAHASAQQPTSYLVEKGRGKGHLP